VLAFESMSGTRHVAAMATARPAGTFASPFTPKKSEPSDADVAAALSGKLKDATPRSLPGTPTGIAMTEAEALESAFSSRF